MSETSGAASMIQYHSTVADDRFGTRLATRAAYTIEIGALLRDESVELRLRPVLPEEVR